MICFQYFSPVIKVRIFNFFNAAFPVCLPPCEAAAPGLRWTWGWSQCTWGILSSAELSPVLSLGEGHQDWTLNTWTKDVTLKRIQLRKWPGDLRGTEWYTVCLGLAPAFRLMPAVIQRQKEALVFRGTRGLQEKYSGIRRKGAKLLVGGSDKG